MKFAMIFHKYGDNIYFGMTDESLWEQIAEDFDEDEIAELKGEKFSGDMDAVTIEFWNEVPGVQALVAQVNEAIAILENGSAYEKAHVPHILRTGLETLKAAR